MDSTVTRMIGLGILSRMLITAYNVNPRTRRYSRELSGGTVAGLGLLLGDTWSTVGLGVGLSTLASGMLAKQDIITLPKFDVFPITP